MTDEEKAKPHESGGDPPAASPESRVMQGDNLQVLKIYELYMQRHMKEMDVMWTRFSIYLTLNTSVVVLVGILNRDHIARLPLGVPVGLWVINLLVFLVAIPIALSWTLINKDTVRWQLIIDAHIAKLEPVLLPEGDGLYTHILKEYEETKPDTEDVSDVNVRLSRFFLNLWTVGALLSCVFLILSILKVIEVI